MQINPKKFFGTSTGFEHMASSLALKCSTIWAMKTQWKEWSMEMMWTAEIQILNEDTIYRRLNEN